MHKRKKIFLSCGHEACFIYFMFVFPYIVGILLATLRGVWWALYISPVVSFALYLIGGRHSIELITLVNGRIKAISSFRPSKQIQRKVNVLLDDIVSITYMIIEDKITHQLYGVPCCRLKLKNGDEKTIMFICYARFQLKALEKAIKEENPNIVFTNELKALYEYH